MPLISTVRRSEAQTEASASLIVVLRGKMPGSLVAVRYMNTTVAT